MNESGNVPYPGHLVAHLDLPGGVVATIRPILPDDFDRETAFVEGLSDTTNYLRLMSPRKLQRDEMWRFTHIDYHRELALVATVTVEGIEQQVAVARYVRGEPFDRAEFAIVVGDAWQRCGVGGALLRHLVDAAREAGVRHLSDITLATNHEMLRLARSLGFTLRREAGDATVTRMTLDL